MTNESSRAMAEKHSMAENAILDCKHGGAVAWGKRYPPVAGKGATNGSAPGYVVKRDD